MQISIRPLEKNISQILPLAESYQRSYNQLSSGYKKPEEMALYKKGFFIKKLRKIAEDENSIVAVLNVDDNPRGFVRYSQIPQYYKHSADNLTQDLEHGFLDGYEFAWYRKVHFNRDVKLDDKTLIVNQIYLDPQIQNQGLGTYLLQKTIPELKKQGFESLIIEYNAHNANAAKFYRGIGFEPFALTKDFDHIIHPQAKTEFCVSDVEIAYTTIDRAIQKMSDKHLDFAFMMTRARNDKTY
ncbi:MAG: GNAT family N-acetyltransferase [Alphaproteobacteria bacterium]|nr:GNAT family N-acetyltransferase [Alphaproteobacteria bacterium]